MTLSIGLCFYCFFKSSGDQIVFVDSLKVFRGFRMTIELQNQAEKTLKRHLKVRDSLEQQYLLKSKQIEREYLAGKIIEAKNSEQAFKESFEQESSQKIWNRIAGYSKEFAKEKGYKLIIGSQSETDLLYGAQELDVTKEMLNFINSKYEGF